jgi:streptogramin lyase
MGHKATILNPNAKVLAGEPALYRGSLWIAGFGGYLARLHPDSGATQREYALRGQPFKIDKLAAGVGSIWAYTDFGDKPRIHKLTPVAGRLGVEEHIMPLDHPVPDFSAGLGGVWTVDPVGTVTWHDPATGGSAQPIQVPGGAEEIALSKDAVWVTTGKRAVVRIDPVTLNVVGKPIALPEQPFEIAADKNVWVTTASKLIEIES